MKKGKVGKRMKHGHKRTNKKESKIAKPASRTRLDFDKKAQPTQIKRSWQKDIKEDEKKESTRKAKKT